MDVEAIRAYCLTKKHVTEEFPFDEHTLVFKVMGKIFLLLPLDEVVLKFNAKNTPDKCIALREEFSSIVPGYHMNKTHWNTVHVDETIPVTILKEIIDDSYNLIVVALPKKVKVNW